MADARDSKSREGNFMRVRPPPSAPENLLYGFFYCGILSPAGHQIPVGTRPRTSRSLALAKNNPLGCFLNASPREGNFMRLLARQESIRARGHFAPCALLHRHQKTCVCKFFWFCKQENKVLSAADHDTLSLPPNGDFKICIFFRHNLGIKT